MGRVLVVSGSGPYADPWHPFAETSQRLAAILADLGHQVVVRDAVEESLAEPGEADLIVVNVGNPQAPRPPARVEAAERGLRRHLHRGGSLLGVHVSATSMTTMPGWSEILGGHWVRGRTRHPEQDEFTVRVRPGAHPIVRRLPDFPVFDERYCFLHTETDITVLAEHVTDDRTHPIVWAREFGPARIVYDGLGHDPRSYDSAGHVELLRRAATWLVPGA